MNRTELKPRNAYTDERRIIGEVLGSENGPTMVVFSGIHGNEKAGVLATEKVLARIRKENLSTFLSAMPVPRATALSGSSET